MFVTQLWAVQSYHIEKDVLLGNFGHLWICAISQEKWLDCHKTINKYIDWKLGLKFGNHLLPWPWPWIVKVKYKICYIYKNKANLRDLIAATGLVISNWIQISCIISYPLVNSNWSNGPETPNLDQIRRFLEPCDLEIWRITLKNNRAPLLSNIKLYVSFHLHMCIQAGVTVRKRLSWIVTSVTMTFDLWPWPCALCMDVTLVLGDNFWKFHDDKMMGI